MGKRVYEVDDGVPTCSEITGLAGCAAILGILVVCGGMTLALLKGLGLLKEQPTPVLPPPATQNTNSPSQQKPRIKTEPTSSSEKTKPGAEAGKGLLVFKTKVPVRRDVDAWVAIDGKKAQTWPAGAKELRLALAPGTYQAAVYSIFGRIHQTIFDQKLAIKEDTTTTVDLEP